MRKIRNGSLLIGGIALIAVLLIVLILILLNR